MDGDWLNTEQIVVRDVDDAKRRLMRLGTGALSNAELVAVLLGSSELGARDVAGEGRAQVRCWRSRPRRWWNTASSPKKRPRG